MPSLPFTDPPDGVRVTGRFDPSCRIEIEGGDRLVAGAKVLVSQYGDEARLDDLLLRLPADFRGQLDISFAAPGTAAAFGAGCRGRWTVRLREEAGLEVGAGSSANGVFIVAARSSVTIGEDCMFSSDVVIQSAEQHAIVDLRTGTRVNPRACRTRLGRHVWLGRRSMLLPDAVVGEGAIVAAGAIVTGAVPAFTVAAGVPARVIRHDVSWSRDHTALDAAVQGYIAAHAAGGGAQPEDGRC